MAISPRYTLTCKPKLKTGNCNPLKKMMDNTYLNKDPGVTLIYVHNYCAIASSPAKNFDNKNNFILLHKVTFNT